MPRYIDADALLSRLPDDLPYKASVKRVLIQAPTADVVPRSEMYDDHYKQVTCYTLGCQEGDKIRPAIAREIFEEIDGITDLFAKGLITELELYDMLAELKKKYTEGE